MYYAPPQASSGPTAYHSVTAAGSSAGAQFHRPGPGASKGSSGTSVAPSQRSGPTPTRVGQPNSASSASEGHALLQQLGKRDLDPGHCSPEMADRASLCSTTTMAPNRRAHDNDALEEDFERLNSRVDISLDELRSELARLRQESTALRVGMESMSGKFSNVAARSDSLEASLLEEVEARAELERGFGKDLKEFVKSEIANVREIMMREMRERMDGQKVFREEVHLQQQALASFTGRVDEAIIELRTELPRLTQETQSLEAVTLKLSESHSVYKERTEALEKYISEESQDRRASLKAASKELKDHVAHEIHSVIAQVVEVRRAGDDSINKVAASQTHLGQEIHDQFAVETERVNQQFAELRKLHNETRMRNDVAQNLLGKEMRDSIAVEVERLTQQYTDFRKYFDDYSARTDDGQKLLSQELFERVNQENKEMRMQVGGEREQRDLMCAELRRQLNELGNRADQERSELSKDLRDYVSLETERISLLIADFRRPLEDLSSRTDTTTLAQKAAQEFSEQLSHDIAEVRVAVTKLDEELADSHNSTLQQALELEKRVAETDVSLRSCVASAKEDTKSELTSWVQTTVVNRVNTLDRGLRTEMAERSTAIQQVVGKVSHNAERWCQLQAKLDELRIEVQRVRVADPQLTRANVPVAG